MRTVFDTETYPVGEELESPFLSGAVRQEAQEAEPSGLLPPATSSPFLSSLTRAEDADREAYEFDSLVAELEDEEFDEAVERLIGEAARVHRASASSWSHPEEAELLAGSDLESWIAPLQSEVDRLFEVIGDRFGERSLDSLHEEEVASFFGGVATEGVWPEAFEDFLGGLIRKAKKVVTGAVRLAKKGVQAVASVLPVKAILGKLAALVRPLLRRVLNTAIGKLPPPVQPLARQLAKRFGMEAEAEADEAETGEASDAGETESFDVHAAGLLFAANDAEQQAILTQAEEEAMAPGHDALAELDAARAELADRLATAPAGSTPVAEIEQFIPAVMAVMPIVKMGLGMLGRDRVVGFLAGRVASLISGQIGAAAARQISRPIVDVGMRMLGLEAPESEAVVGGEALASTVEDTVRRVMELPAEAFEDELRLDATVQESFAAAAAAHLPDNLLRPDLPERETAGEGGVWVLMPRHARPRYRYKKYTRVFPVAVTRQLARAVRWEDGASLESHLLDRGVRAWPVQAEAHLYEAVPGTSSALIGEDEAGADEVGGLQPLTTEMAGLLLREPGLGRRLPAAARPSVRRLPLRPGQRFVRLRVPGHLVPPQARPRRRVLVRVELAARPPRVAVQLRLSEREGQELAERLARRDSAGGLTWLKKQFDDAVPPALAARLVRHARSRPGQPMAVEALGRAVDAVNARAAAAFAALVRDMAAVVVDAARSTAQGMTIELVFSAADAASLLKAPPAPSVAVRPGWGRD